VLALHAACLCAVWTGVLDARGQMYLALAAYAAYAINATGFLRMFRQLGIGPVQLFPPRACARHASPQRWHGIARSWPASSPCNWSRRAHPARRSVSAIPGCKVPRAVGLMANSMAALPEVARTGKRGIVDLLLNPKWYEGVRQTELHVTNTTGQVQPWVYDKLSETVMRGPAGRRRAGRRLPPSPCSQPFHRPSGPVYFQTCRATRRKFPPSNAVTCSSLHPRRSRISTIAGSSSGAMKRTGPPGYSRRGQ